MTQILDQEWQQLAANAICHAAEGAKNDVALCAADVAHQHMRPSVLFRPALSVDGDHYCALYGPNLVEGIAGFGKSAAEAMADFDANWTRALPTPQGEDKTP